MGANTELSSLSHFLISLQAGYSSRIMHVWFTFQPNEIKSLPLESG